MPVNKKWLQYLLGSAILLYIYSLIHRVPDVDDAWVGELAYFQAKLGYAKSELMRGVTLQEIRHICNHKFLTLQGGLFISLFGFGLYTLKSVSLVYLVIFSLCFYYYAKKKGIENNYILLFFLLLFTNALIFEFSFIYRPEIPLMTLGFLSYIFIEKAVEENKNEFRNVFAAGLFAGLCVATHLNGVVFLAAGFILLLINKKYSSAIVFALFSLPTITIYFYDFHSLNDFNFCYYQMTQNPSIDTSSDTPLLLKLLYNILNEQKRFFHSAVEISFTALCVLVFTLSWKYLKKYKSMMIYTLIVIICIGIFSVHKTPKYSIIYFPYLVLLIVYGIKSLNTNDSNYLFGKQLNRKSISIICSVLLLFYFISNSIYNVKLCSVKFSASQNSDIVQRYIPGNTKELRIVAPMTFIFNEIDSFKTIQGEMYYTEMQKTDSTLYQKGFLESTKKFNIDYIILSPPHIELLGMNNCPDAIIDQEGFTTILNADTLLILKRFN